MLSIIVGGLLAVIVIFAIINWKAFLRLIGVASAKANTIADAAEDASRVDLVKAAIEKDKEALRKANDQRVEQQKRVNTVKRIHEKCTQDVSDLHKRISVSVDQNRKLQLARDLVTAKADLARAEEDLALQTKIYEDFRRECDSFEQKIRDSEHKVNRSIQQLELSKASAEIAELTAPTFASAGSEVDKQLEEVQKKIDRNQARGQVARERNAGAYALEEENKRIADQDAIALLEQIEAENKAKKGLDDLFPPVKEQA